MTQTYSDKETSQTYTFPITSLDAVTLNFRRLVGTWPLFRELKQRRRQRQRNRHLKIYLYFILCYFAIISTRSTFTKMANYPGTKLVGVAYKLRKKMKNARAERLFLLFKPIVLRRCRCRRRHRCLSSLVFSERACTTH